MEPDSVVQIHGGIRNVQNPLEGFGMDYYTKLVNIIATRTHNGWFQPGNPRLTFEPVWGFYGRRR